MVIKSAEFITSAVKPRGYPPAGPPEVAFAGRSNVGKSSLINTLVRRRKLVKVSGQPGRTQQINFFAINGEELRLVDLPGYGYAKVPKAVKAAWRPMVEAYLSRRASLKAVVVIVDIRRQPTAEDLMLLEWLSALKLPAILAITKADKLSRNQQAGRLAELRPVLTAFDPEPTLFSAASGLGREALWERVCAAAGV
ncbi:MAG: ribosome biogenesis GTP-binding protein YihA/YsxC [Thermodesulfobacteriota bacterium]